MNSRIESGKSLWDCKEDAIAAVHKALDDEEINDIYVEDDKHIAYESDNGVMVMERDIYFPSEETVDTLKERICYDENVKRYVDPDKFAEFLYNCIDVDALSAVRGVALVWNEPILDEFGVTEGYDTTKARQELNDMVADGCDSYADEIGFDNKGEPLFGVLWNERSAIVINVDECVDIAEFSAKTDALDFRGDEGVWRDYFSKNFQEAFVSTVIHEFRHAVYELNEFLPVGEDERYPTLGGEESEVEKYGDEEYYKLLDNSDAKALIEAMLNTYKGREHEIGERFDTKSEPEKPKKSKQVERD